MYLNTDMAQNRRTHNYDPIVTSTTQNIYNLVNTFENSVDFWNRSLEIYLVEAWVRDLWPTMRLFSFYD
jgi:hypothetical protein